MPNNYISQINTPDNTSYQILDRGAARKESGIYYVEGPSTDTQGAWTGTITDVNIPLDAYYNGLKVVYVPGVKASETTTLNINNLGAKVCYADNNVKIRSNFPASTIITFIYRNNAWYKINNDAATAEVAEKVGHTLTIGTFVFDGSADVVVPIYEGQSNE